MSHHRFRLSGETAGSLKETTSSFAPNVLCWWKRRVGVVRVHLAQPPDRRSPTERAPLTVTSVADRSWARQRPSVDVSLHITAYLSRSEEHTSELQSLRHLVCRL